LDEIGDVSPRIQIKLLRVLEEKEFERVGESVPTRTDARVIACTNQDLKE
jgi:transcriptional regulator with GAF, ATPase, and Fis domain